MLERRRVAERWRSERWDSLRFQFPNWSLRLPGHAYAGDSEAFAHRDEVVRFLEEYANAIKAPLRCGVEATALRQDVGSGRFVIETREHAQDGGHRESERGATLESRVVVIATGPYQRPRIPTFGADLPSDVLQLHASRYRNPEQLPDGAVLVVGSGASGSQIAEELHLRGRQVFFAIGRHHRTRRHYRGQDLLWWLKELKLLERTRDQFAAGQFPPPLAFTGAGGGRHELDLRQFAAAGVTLVGHLLGIRGRMLHFADDVDDILRKADAALEEFEAAVDRHVRETGIAAPAEAARPRVGWRSPSPGRTEIDMRQSGIKSLIWCTGYQDNYGWVELPVLDAAGRPIQRRGVTACPGAYFLGLRWMHTWGSTFVFTVGDDAAYLAEHIAARP